MVANFGMYQSCFLPVNYVVMCEIWGSHSGVNEVSSLLGCYAMSSGKKTLYYKIPVTVYQMKHHNIPENINLHVLMYNF